MEQPRCYDHKDSKDLPSLCPTCQRINVEYKIVRKTVAKLLNAGYALRTDEQDDPRPEKPTRKQDEILAEMAAVDDEFLAVFDGVDDGLPMGWVRFVYGNDGWDLISDYTTNLSSIIDPICEWAEKSFAL